MATDNETLYLVEKFERPHDLPAGGKTLVFRTRAKARAYAKAKNAKSRKFHFKVRVAKWGPSA